MLTAACGGNKPPVPVAPPPTGPQAFPGATAGGGTPTPPRPPDPPPLPPDVVASAPLDPLANRSVEEINGPNSPLKPVFFLYDSDTLDDEAKKVLAANAEVLKKYRTWVITVEGHCDERGTAEYNLSLGDRRALAARNYLVSLGIAADRVTTVSKGKESPVCTDKNEACWQRNRRGGSIITAK
jgi:peptidoglycan-associated lipoprotein